MKNTKEVNSLAFKEFEANEVFRVAIFISKKIEDLEKNMYEDDNLEKYLYKRKKIVQLIEDFKKDMVEVINE